MPRSGWLAPEHLLARGYRAACLLERLMKGGARPRHPVLIKPVRLLARRSTEGFAVEDQVLACALRYIAEHSRERIGVDAVRAGVYTFGAPPRYSGYPVEEGMVTYPLYRGGEDGALSNASQEPNVRG